MTDQARPLDLDALGAKRRELRARHAAALRSLLDTRTDLRGVNALVDHFDEGIQWTA